MSPESVVPPKTIVEHATCLACGCLCDDIRVEAEGGRIVEAVHACQIGRAWFLKSRPGEGHPSASIDGQPAALEEAIARAVEILAGAKAPVIWGLSMTTIEAVRTALAIADRIGAVVDVSGSSDGPGQLSAFQRVGQVSASLGEVKDRADLVVFWGVNPVVTHPRHWERYSVAPRGRFVPEGRAGRFVIVVDELPSETSQLADLFVPIARDHQPEALQALRAMVRGVTLDPNRVVRSTGLAYSKLEELAERLKAGRYGAFFFGPTMDANDLGGMAFEPALALVRELNVGRRFVAMEMGRPGNPSGATSVLTWQAGAPSAVDYGLGHPRHLPGEATLLDRMTAREVDAVLIVGDHPMARLPIDRVFEGLKGVPVVVIAPGAVAGWAQPNSVAFDVARPGLEVGGTVARVDGVMLPLRPLISCDVPSDVEILQALARRLGA